MVDPHGDRVARERALVQDLDVRALDEAELEQAVLDLGGGEAVGVLGHMNGVDPAAESARRRAERKARVPVHRPTVLRHRVGPGRVSRIASVITLYLWHGPPQVKPKPCETNTLERL
jgi:hypothetical protein